MEKKYFVEFSSPLIKEEKKLINFLVKKQLSSHPLQFLITDLDIPKLRNSKLNFIDRFSKKAVYLYRDSDIQFVPIFQQYLFKDSFIEFSFNPIFLEYLNDEEKIFQFNLPQVLFFKYDFSKDFFYNVIKPHFIDSIIELSIDEFKEIIKRDKYKRIYDIKRFLIEPLVEDINLSTNFKLKYEVIKKEGNPFINFYIKNNQIDEIKNYVKNFLRLYKHYILEPKKLKLIIFKAIQTYGYSYTKNKLLLTIKNKKKYNLKFDDIFEKFLNNELGEFYVILKSLECNPKDINTFSKIIFKELSPLDIPEIAKMDYNTHLSQKIFSMKEKDKIEIFSENLKLELLYNPAGTSKIEISLKYIK